MEKICDTVFAMVTFNNLIMKYQHIEPIVNASDKWFNLPWKKFEKESYRLQRRIYEACKTGDIVKTKGLQKLMFHTYMARTNGCYTKG